jgi:hypothetical protein
LPHGFRWSPVECAVYGVSDKPMSAEEWKKQYVKEG